MKSELSTQEMLGEPTQIQHHLAANGMATDVSACANLASETGLPCEHGANGHCVWEAPA